MDKQGLTRINTAWALFQGLLIEALPFLLIGVLISALARWLAPGGRWLRRLPAHPLLGPLSGAALGFALPACECGNVPVARRMLVGGAPLGTALGFLFAAPVLNPIVIASTWAAFPAQPWLLLARPIGAVLVALALSLLLRLIPEERLLQADVLAERQLNQPLSAVNLLQRRSGLVGIAATTATNQQESRQPMSRPPLQEVLSHGGREFMQLALLLVAGCVLAALVQTLLPRQWLLDLGSSPSGSIMALQTGQRCRNRAVCGLDRRRFGFLSQKSAHGCGKRARGLVFLQTLRQLEGLSADLPRQQRVAGLQLDHADSFGQITCSQ